MRTKKLKSISQVLINQKTAPWIFVSPFIISFLLFTLYPLINTFIMSFQDIAGFDDVTFIGLKNYKNLCNEQFFHALQNSTIYTILTIIILIPLPMVLAVLINSKTTRFKNFFKSASSLFNPSLGKRLRNLLNNSLFTTIPISSD